MRAIPVLISIVVAMVASCVVATTPHRTLARQDEAAPRRATLFDLPGKRMERLRLQQMMVLAVSQQNFAAAMNAVRGMTQLEPEEPTGWYNLACLQAVTGDSTAALETLKLAVKKGFRDVQHLRNDTDLITLRDTAEFAEILKGAEAMQAEPLIEREFLPGPIEDGVAIVTEKNTRWSDQRFSLITEFEPTSPPDKSAVQIRGNAPAEKLVADWIREGSAAGHHGDLYDNRDRDHSQLNLQKFPQLVRVEYSPEAMAANADWGVRIGQAFAQPTLGNSSTSHVGMPYWRSNARALMHEDLFMKLVYNQFVNNQLYCYPEHADFDPEHGDVYPANTSFWVISQGSSGSDQPFMEAIALTLAAFRPEVKSVLTQKNMLMPVVQMLLRRSQKTVETEEDYFSGKAHPVVFQSSQLDPLRMVTLAHELTTESLPAVVQLKVIGEDSGVPGRDYFHPAPAERLFDTPAAIARVYRSTAFQRRMVIDASGSTQLDGGTLSFRWAVLQGDPQHVSIKPLRQNGSRAEITIDWHERAPIPDLKDMYSNRVDIGVFALNGKTPSLPAFISSFTLASEKRIYNDRHQIQSVDYGDAEYRSRYVDPLLDVPKNWRDDYLYDADHSLIGWTRSFPEQPPQEFSADGRLIWRKDDDGRAVEWRHVRYVASTLNRQTPVLRQMIIPPGKDTDGGASLQNGSAAVPKPKAP